MDTENPTTTETPARDPQLLKILAALGLAETATEAEIEGKIAELLASATTAATAQTSLQALQTERDTLQVQYDELWKKQQDLDKRQREAEADAALEPLEGKLPDEKVAEIRALYISNPESAKLALEVAEMAMKAAAPAQTGEKPPKPTHDPEGDVKPEPTAKDKAAEGEALIAAIRKEGKFATYQAARTEAIRRQPELFQ